MMSRHRAALSALTAAAALCAALLAPATSGAQAAGPKAECPATLDCEFVPAAYQLTDPNNVQSYGNFDMAQRPNDVPIKYIVLHDTEEDYPTTLRIFQDPKRAVSAHYVVRSGDGHIAQMVRTKDVAWQAGNWYINGESIGIEQEGFAVDGATWFTPAMYRSTARLVKYLAAKYDIPLDRQHIIGHDGVPGITPANVAGMHWDPGPYWDWARFFKLLGKPINPNAGPASNVVTINPAFKDNVQQLRDCEGNVDLPAQATSFVPLHTQPSDDSPLFSDPGLHTNGSPGTNCANDWGSKASAGESFVVAERQGDWTAIWYAGGKAWFHNPSAKPVTVPTKGWTVVPKAGRTEIPTYGRAYPEAAAYPSTIPFQSIVPLQYTIKAGESYVSGGPSPTGYYYAKSFDDSLPDDHTFVAGQEQYITIQLGHRIGYVKASDVDVVPSGQLPG